MGVMTSLRRFSVVLGGLAVMALTFAGTSAFFSTYAWAENADLHNVATELSDPAQNTIVRQLKALRARDAGQAFSLTTPTFHEKFKSPGKFITRMRFEYRPLYNNAEHTFLEHRATDEGVMQNVEIKDSYGEKATVIFRLKQQEDGQWLIDSFTVLDSQAQPV